MVRIAITQAAFEAIAKTLPLGSVGYENKVNEKGERLIWLDPGVVDRLWSLCGPGESYSEVILRVAAGGCGGRLMAEILGTWEGVERQVGAIRRRLMDKPGMEPEALARVRARLERVLGRLVADGPVWVERPDVVVDLHALLAEIDRRAGAALGPLLPSRR
jgi:hypothetical protein